MMTNERYRQLIIYRYVEGRTNEETAGLLSMNMNNYYNKHRLAKRQFREVLKKEGLI
jgi:DNA-directed RNA polymerase specialized sigma24 family protein